eukprot:1140350-Pelagomonas_calceolata.AAC.1
MQPVVANVMSMCRAACTSSKRMQLHPPSTLAASTHAGFAGLSGAQEAPQFDTIRAALQDLGATDFITILEAATGASILDNENQA